MSWAVTSTHYIQYPNKQHKEYLVSNSMTPTKENRTISPKNSLLNSKIFTWSCTAYKIKHKNCAHFYKMVNCKKFLKSFPTKIMILIPSADLVRFSIISPNSILTCLPLFASVNTTWSTLFFPYTTYTFSLHIISVLILHPLKSSHNLGFLHEVFLIILTISQSSFLSINHLCHLLNMYTSLYYFYV